MIGLVGINFKSAPLNIREKFSFTDEEVLSFLKLLKINRNVLGAVVLSTCNRTEIYYHIEKSNHPEGFDFLIRNLEYFKNYDKKLEKYFYFKQGDEAIEHLFRVVSGIDSLVIGEDQIIGQVKSAFKRSLDNDASSSVLTRLFNKAFEAGKRVRTETGIKQGPTSVSSAAIELCVSRYTDFSDKRILLIGTGQTGELALLSLIKKGCRNIYITNRTYSKAVGLAKKYHATAFEINELLSYLPACDIVLVATSSKTHIITSKIAGQAVQIRNAAQLYIDLSVPRNVSEKVGKMDNIELIVIDDLKEIVKISTEKRKGVISDAMEIINIVKQEFKEWLDVLELTPLILKIKNNFHKINEAELAGFIKVNSISDSEAVTNYAKHITEKYARMFIKKLKNVTENGKKKEFVNLVEELFELA